MVSIELVEKLAWWSVKKQYQVYVWECKTVTSLNPANHLGFSEIG